jgi:hypothetical protein
MATPRQPGVHEDEIDALLDKLCNLREEVLSIERSLERIQATKRKKWGNGSGKASGAAP